MPNKLTSVLVTAALAVAPVAEAKRMVCGPNGCRVVRSPVAPAVSYGSSGGYATYSHPVRSYGSSGGSAVYQSYGSSGGRVEIAPVSSPAVEATPPAAAVPATEDGARNTPCPCGPGCECGPECRCKTQVVSTVPASGTGEVVSFVPASGVSVVSVVPVSVSTLAAL